MGLPHVVNFLVRATYDDDEHDESWHDDYTDARTTFLMHRRRISQCTNPYAECTLRNVRVGSVERAKPTTGEGY